MRLLVDMGHPAHVHFFKNAIRELEKRGHEVKITARDKDVTLELLEAYGFAYAVRGSGGAGTLRKGLGMARTDMKMLRIAKEFKPSVMAGILNPYTAQVSRMVGAKSITFTDTEHAKAAQRITFPFTDVIVTPEAYLLDHGEKHVRYNGYQELAYLHPNWFTPDPTVFDELGVTKDEKYAIVRFVSWEASHDVGQTGFTTKMKIKTVKEIEKHATPMITSEGKIPKELQKYQIRIPPHRIHDALYYATLYIGEGATMASEAAVMGTPNILINPLAKDCGNFKEMAEKYELLKYHDSISGSFNDVIEFLVDENANSIWNERKENMLNEKIDLIPFLIQTLNQVKDEE